MNVCLMRGSRSSMVSSSRSGEWPRSFSRGRSRLWLSRSGSQSHPRTEVSVSLTKSWTMSNSLARSAWGARTHSRSRSATVEK